MSATPAPCTEWLDLHSGIIYEMDEADLPEEVTHYEPVPAQPSPAWRARQRFVRVRAQLNYGRLGCVEAMTAAWSDWERLPAHEKLRILSSPP